MTEFTNGPWRALLNGAEDTAVASPGGIIADLRCIDDYPSSSQVTANAHLIAAGPDLYSALEKMITHFTMLPDDLTEPDSVIGRAKAALSKARGEKQ